MLMEAAMVYPIATPTRLKYWMNPQIFTWNPPEIFQNTLRLGSVSFEKKHSDYKISENRTKIALNSFHIRIVSFSGDRVAGAVASGEKARGVVSHKWEKEKNGGSGDPTQLRGGPCQWQHTGADNRSYDMCTCSPNITYSDKRKIKSQNQ